MSSVQPFRRKTIRLLSGLVAILTSLASVPAPAVAARIATPTYQVKLQVADNAIDAAGNPTAAFAEFAHLGKQTGYEESMYVDTSDRLYQDSGWSIRLRHKANNSDFHVTYKWRNKLADNSLSSSVVNEGLQAAKDRGFDSADKNYEAQVNTSHSSSTLDFSNKKAIPCVAYACVLPEKAIATKIAENLEPGKLQKAMGTTLSQQTLLVTDVVTQKTWDVRIAGVKTDLEISTIGGKYWIEISEEDNSRHSAIKKREKLIGALQAAGFLNPQDAFKTGVALKTLH